MHNVSRDATRSSKFANQILQLQKTKLPSPRSRIQIAFLYYTRINRENRVIEESSHREMESSRNGIIREENCFMLYFAELDLD